MIFYVLLASFLTFILSFSSQFHFGEEIDETISVAAEDDIDEGRIAAEDDIGAARIARSDSSSILFIHKTNNGESIQSLGFAELQNVLK